MSNYSKLYCFILWMCYDLSGDIMDEILKAIVDEKRKDYKCFDMLKRYLNSDSEFQEFVRNGILTNRIYGFDEELWNKIDSLNVRSNVSFEGAFALGLNEGNCTKFSRYLSYCFPCPDICGGTLPILVGSKNSEDGRHTWVVNRGMIYDTSLMLIMEEGYAKKGLKYNEENRYNPNLDHSYTASKEFATDNKLNR